MEDLDTLYQSDDEAGFHMLSDTFAKDLDSDHTHLNKLTSKP